MALHCGESLAAQEAGFGDKVLIGYLLGLGTTPQASALQHRLAGAMVAGAELYLTLEQLEGPLLLAISS